MRIIYVLKYIQIFLPYYFYKKPRNRMSKKRNVRQPMKPIKIMFFFHNSFRCSVLSSFWKIWGNGSEIMKHVAWLGGGDAKGPLRKPARRKVPPEKHRITQQQVAFVGKREHADLPIGCQSMVLRERDLRKGHWIWASRVLLATLDNSERFFSKCQVHIYLI